MLARESTASARSATDVPDADEELKAHIWRNVALSQAKKLTRLELDGDRCPHCNRRVWLTSKGEFRKFREPRQ